jgi:long-subunit acyl-CoA synthetase (AMP-forming)
LQEVTGNKGVIRSKSIEELTSQVKSIALWLLDNGIKKEDRIILLVNHFNLDWLAADMAIHVVGRLCPVHYPQRESDLKFIFEDQTCFVDSFN